MFFVRVLLKGFVEDYEAGMMPSDSIGRLSKRERIRSDQSRVVAGGTERPQAAITEHRNVFIVDSHMGQVIGCNAAVSECNQLDPKKLLESCAARAEVAQRRRDRRNSARLDQPFVDHFLELVYFACYPLIPLDFTFDCGEIGRGFGQLLPHRSRRGIHGYQATLRQPEALLESRNLAG